MKEDFFKLLALRYFQSITIKTPSPNYHLVSSCLCHWIQRVFPNHWKNHSYHSAMQYFPMHTCHQRNMIPRLLVLLTFDLLFFLIFYEIVLQKIQRFFLCTKKWCFGGSVRSQLFRYQHLWFFAISNIRGFVIFLRTFW